jgi:iron complex transport system ATP-binding protein
LLRAGNVSFAYGDRTVVRDVTLEVRPGDLVGIIGPNGSGKTTLLRLLAGLLRPANGDVTLDGTSLRSIPRAALARRLAMVPQETHPSFDYSVLEMALMGRYPHLGAFELEGPDDVAIAERALASTGTSAFASRLFATLSGGEKQRVVIASALAQLGGSREQDQPAAARGEILLLDEPTASLDLGYQLEIAAMIERLNRAAAVTIVVSTHDLNLAARVCRQIVMLSGGAVAAAGETERVLTPALIETLYGVEAEVSRPASVGHAVIVPIRPSHRGPA